MKSKKEGCLKKEEVVDCVRCFWGVKFDEERDKFFGFCNIEVVGDFDKRSFSDIVGIGEWRRSEDWS